MAAEDVAAITAGMHGLAERVAYRYAAIERKHRFRFLFDPLRLLEQIGFIESYLAGGNPFPLSVEIDPSNACNHDCGFCIYHSMHRKDRTERLSRDSLLSIVDQLPTLGCRSILFVGGGEPMTNPHTVEAIERGAARGCACGLVTNGSLIGAPGAARLKRAATYVRFSLDAATRETHLALHRRDDFDRIVWSLRSLAGAEGPATVGAGYFITDANVHDIFAAAQLVKDVGADYIQFKTYSGLPMEPGLHERVLRAIDRALDLSDPTFDVHVMDRIFENRTFQVRGYSRCHFQAMKTIINADGSVYLCAQKRTDPAGRIGNVHEQSLAAIWNGVKRRRVVNRLDLASCPFCVHDNQNKMIEFMAHFRAPHRGFY
ncbi:MAG TPA: radical SAM protein [Bryobacteraceae bacterium]|nr:radical SAM protein [Bryobacteraceae bacterium]